MTIIEMLVVLLIAAIGGFVCGFLFGVSCCARALYDREIRKVQKGQNPVVDL